MAVAYIKRVKMYRSIILFQPSKDECLDGIFCSFQPYFNILGKALLSIADCKKVAELFDFKRNFKSMKIFKQEEFDALNEQYKRDLERAGNYAVLNGLFITFEDGENPGKIISCTSGLENIDVQDVERVYLFTGDKWLVCLEPKNTLSITDFVDLDLATKLTELYATLKGVKYDFSSFTTQQIDFLNEFYKEYKKNSLAWSYFDKKYTTKNYAVAIDILVSHAEIYEAEAVLDGNVKVVNSDKTKNKI